MKKTAIFRILCALLALLLLLPLGACSKYRLEMSTEREARAVLTLDGQEVAFELLYFFYHNTPSDATHEEKLAASLREICDLYAILNVTKQHGLDPYSGELAESLDALVRETIDEFSARADYIDSLKKAHMTDTVYRLLLLSQIARNRLLEPEDGVSLVSDEKILAYCQREDVIRVMALIVEFDESILSWAENRAEALHASVTADNTDSGFMHIANSRATGAEEHRYMLASQWMDLTGSTEPPVRGEISAPLFSYNNFLILRVGVKDMDYVQANTEELLPAYMEHLVYLESERLADTLVTNEVYAALTAEDFR